MTYDYNDDAYDQLIKETQIDNRVGNHLFLVTNVINDYWPSGDERCKIRGQLQTANNAKADLTISPPPSPEVVKAESKSWEDGKKKAIAQTISLYRQLRENYAKDPTEIQEGDVYAVKTVKTRVKEDGSGGFIRIAAFLSRNRISAEAQADADNAPPF